MIIYLLLKLILFVLGVVSKLFGSLIPSFPTVLSDLLKDLSTMIEGGINFISYFFHWQVLVSIISLVIAVLVTMFLNFAYHEFCYVLSKENSDDK